MAHKQISDFILERYLLGELPVSEQSAIEALLLHNPQLTQHLNELEQSNKDILRQYPSEYFTDQIEQRIKKPTSPKASFRFQKLPTILKIAPLLAAAWLFTILFIPNSSPQITDNTGIATPVGDQYPDKTIAKGSPADPPQTRLVIFHKISAEQVIEIKPGSLLKSGDLIQIAYTPGPARYGMIFSIDGNGTVTLHQPEGENSSNILTPTNKQLLIPNAYELDDAPGFERFFFVTSKIPFSCHVILKNIREFAAHADILKQPLPLGKDFSINSITVIK